MQKRNESTYGIQPKLLNYNCLSRWWEENVVQLWWNGVVVTLMETRGRWFSNSPLWKGMRDLTPWLAQLHFERLYILFFILSTYFLIHRVHSFSTWISHIYFYTSTFILYVLSVFRSQHLVSMACKLFQNFHPRINMFSYEGRIFHICFDVTESGLMRRDLVIYERSLWPNDERPL